MTGEALALAGIVGALAVGVVSPGPSFILVARTAMAGSRRQGLFTALGMGLGGAVFAAAALAGLQLVFHAVPTLYAVLKVAGGLYLCWLGWLIARHAREPLAVGGAAGPQASGARALGRGLATQLSNPKTAIVYASVFAAFLPPRFSPVFAVAVLASVFAVETLWYALVALLLSAPRPQRAYLRAKTAVDRVAGAVLAALGLRLVFGP